MLLPIATHRYPRRSAAASHRPYYKGATLLQPEQLQEKIATLERQLADAKSAVARSDEKLRLSAASAEMRDREAAMRAAEDAKRIETLEREVAATAQKADSLRRSLRKAREEAAGGRSDGGIAAAADLEAQLESVSAALEAERLEAKRAKRAAAEEIAELQRMLEVRREEHARASERDRCPVHGQTCHLPPPTSPVPAEPALFSWRAPLAASQWRWRGRVRRNTCQWMRSAHADELTQLQQQLTEARASADQSLSALQVGLGCSGPAGTCLTRSCRTFQWRRRNCASRLRRRPMPRRRPTSCPQNPHRNLRRNLRRHRSSRLPLRPPQRRWLWRMSSCWR